MFAFFSHPPVLTVAASAVPTPWNALDIGQPQPGGAASEAGGVYSLSAGGIGPSATTDGFQFVYQSVTGDFALTARVTRMSGTPSGPSAGLMVRDALADNVNFVALDATHSGVDWQWREPWSPDAQRQTASSTVFVPVWLRLVKRGTHVTGYEAPDANGAPGTWQRSGESAAISDEMLYAGLFLTSGGAGDSADATVDHVSLSVGPQPALDAGTYKLSPVSAPAMTLTAGAGSAQLAAPTGLGAQTWTFTAAANGQFIIRPASDTADVLSVAGGGTANGTRLALLPDQGLPSQRWSAAVGPGDSVLLSPASAPTRVLDDFGGVATPQAVLDIWDRMPNDPHTEWTVTAAK